MRQQFDNLPTTHLPDVYALPRDHTVSTQHMLAPCEDLDWLWGKFRRFDFALSRFIRADARFRFFFWISHAISLFLLDLTCDLAFFIGSHMRSRFFYWISRAPSQGRRGHHRGALRDDCGSRGRHGRARDRAKDGRVRKALLHEHAPDMQVELAFTRLDSPLLGALQAHPALTGAGLQARLRPERRRGVPPDPHAQVRNVLGIPSLSSLTILNAGSRSRPSRTSRPSLRSARSPPTCP
jgi:hypothetical protein